MALLQHADYLATYLESVPALDGVPVLVDREHNIESAVLEALNRAQGRLILISWTGWPAPQEGGGPLLTLEHTVSLITLPTFLEQAGLDTFDTLLSALVGAVHHWSPDSTDGAYCQRHWRVGAGRLLTSPDFLVWTFDASIDDDVANPIA